MRKYIFLFSLLFFANAVSACEISFKIIGDDKACYAVGEIVKVEVFVDFLQEKCTDNPKKTFVYRKGLKTIDEGEWIIEGTTARKILTMEVVGNKKNELMLTASRRTTKDECFEQFKIEMCIFNN